MIDRLELRLRRWRRRLSRSEWMIRLLGLSRSEGTASEPGLIIIQIDGLARVQFEDAMRRKRMPFLRSLLRKQGYALHTHYSGLPSSTPAVQAELHYGVRTAVPAFSFLDRVTGRVFRMFYEQDAAEMERRLATQGEGLLKGGSAYSNIYTGGAAEAHFCGPTLGWNGFWSHGSPWALPLVFILHINTFLRTIGLGLVELGLAIWDAAHGIFSGQDIWREFKFIPARVGISIVSRELNTIGTQIDIARGLPIIHLNFLGYDEQSHRRGPSSAFAHWGLKGIDGAVKRIWRSARRSARRHYSVWIFSDHGQEDTIPYQMHYGKSVGQAVREVFHRAPQPEAPGEGPRSGEQNQRVQLLGGRVSRRLAPKTPSLPHVSGQEEPVVTAMGPIGHIYMPELMPPEQREAFARRLVAEAHIPLVLWPTGDARLRAVNEAGAWTLPEDAAEVLGAEHPAMEAVLEDLDALCRHPNAGSFVISGWRPEGKPFSFPSECGSHAGPGFHETQGFAMFPPGTALPPLTRGQLRPSTLRKAARVHLGRIEPDWEQNGNGATRREAGTLRIVTYNVHSCIGVDGSVSPRRIARLIARLEPDVVCLQELDVGRQRTGGDDQAHMIARELEMDHHFHPTIKLEEERYGDAILSRLPMRLVRAGALPGRPVRAGRPPREPRGALWAAVEVDGREIQVINTHLGLSGGERRLQAEALLGPDWLGDPRCQGPVVLCGDLNALPRSVAWRLLSSKLRDAQRALDNHRPRKTWFGRIPIGRIDHVFINGELEVTGIQVVSADPAKIASDHLPLVVDLKLPAAAAAPRENHMELVGRAKLV